MNRKKHGSDFLTFFIVGCAVFFAVSLGLVRLYKDHAIPPYEMTAKRFYVLRKEILDYCRVNDRLPASLDLLDGLERQDSLDGWNRLILYKTNFSGKVTLISVGTKRTSRERNVKDELRAEFDTKGADNSWVQGSAEWIVFMEPR